MSDKDVIFTPASRSSSPVESAFEEALVIQNFDDGKVDLAKTEDLKIDKHNSDLRGFADNKVATHVNQPLGKWAENLSKVEVSSLVKKSLCNIFGIYTLKFFFFASFINLKNKYVF